MKISLMLFVSLLLVGSYFAGDFYARSRIENSCIHDIGKTWINGHAYVCVDFDELQKATAQRDQKGA